MNYILIGRTNILNKYDLKNSLSSFFVYTMAVVAVSVDVGRVSLLFLDTSLAGIRQSFNN